MTIDYKKLIWAMPAAVMLLGATACSGDGDTPEATVENNDGISFSIPLGGTRANNGMQNLPQLSNLYVATYTAAGEKVEDIVVAGQVAKGTDGNAIEASIVDNDKFGAMLTAYLPYKTVEGRKNYKDIIVTNDKGLKFVAFYLPGIENFGLGEDALKTEGSGKQFVMPAKLSDVSTSVAAAYTLNYPQTNGVWQPASDMEVPMSGVLDVTTALKSYNPTLWNKNNPMFLNNDPLVLIRAMAKVTVEGKVDSQTAADSKFITGVEFLTKSKGALLFDPTTLVKEGSNYVVNKALEVAGDNRWISGAVKDGKYEFYTFERDFSGSASRGVIKVHWTGHDDKVFDFKNYAAGAIQTVAPWNGILRNYHYQFTINKPADQEFTVSVKLEKWEAYDYSEKI